MAALEVETSLAEGEQARQAWSTWAREHAGPREAHAAAKGLFKRLWPMGLAAMTWSCAECGTGAGGAAMTRADGLLLTREKPLRGRQDFSLCGPCAGARTCDRTAGEPGICPLDAPVHRPERGDASVLPEWRTGFAGEPPVKERAGGFAQLCALEGAERVLREVAQAAPEDDAGVSAQRPVPPAARAGALLVVRVDGQGVPMITAAAVQLTATWGTGAQRQQQTEALVGVSSTGEAQPRAPAALADLLGDPDAARARRPREGTRDEAPRAQQSRRLARVVRMQQAVMEGITADAARRDPQPRQPVVVRLDGALGWSNRATQIFNAWRRRTCVLDIMPVVGYRWRAANAWCEDGSQQGKRGVQAKRADMLRGRVGSGIGGRRPLLTTRQLRKAGRETRAHVITCFQNHRRWRPYEAYRAAGWPGGTGGVESAGGSVVKHRLEGAGKRGSLTGAEAMLAWRSLKKSPDHALRDDGRFRARQVRARLDGRPPTYRPMRRMKHVA